MDSTRAFIGGAWPVVLVMALLGGCEQGAKNQQTVTVYCSHDRTHSEAILKDFEAKTGLRLRIKWDTEANKTTGLVNTLIAESDHPRCDVFWNNEVSQTVRLAERGCLAPYESPSAKDIPANFKDAQHLWAGFGARARIFIVNNKALPEAERPKRLEDMGKAAFKGRFALAKPLFGTTATHAAVLFQTMGADKAKALFGSWKTNQAAILAGNAQVKDRVVAGEFAFGMTDTDDFNLARLEGKPVSAVFPGQGPNGRGCLLIPNSVALIKNAPHPEAAKKLIDYLLSEDVEARLAASRSAQIPVRQGVSRPDWMPEDLKFMSVDWAAVGQAFEGARRYIEAEFLR